jgi:hypothetical protein
MKYDIGLNIIVDEKLTEKELSIIQKAFLDSCECLIPQLSRNICFIFYKNDESKSGIMSVNFVDGILTVNE